MNGCEWLCSRTQDLASRMRDPGTCIQDLGSRTHGLVSGILQPGSRMLVLNQFGSSGSHLDSMASGVNSTPLSAGHPINLATTHIYMTLYIHSSLFLFLFIYIYRYIHICSIYNLLLGTSLVFHDIVSAQGLSENMEILNTHSRT